MTGLLLDDLVGPRHVDVDRSLAAGLILLHNDRRLGHGGWGGTTTVSGNLLLLCTKGAGDWQEYMCIETATGDG